MKLAFCVEDESDRAVFQGMISRLLDLPVEAHPVPYRLRGRSMAMKWAAEIARDAFNKGADGVVFAIDNDGEPTIHDHPLHATASPRCRLCALSWAANVGPLEARGRSRGTRMGFVFAVPVQTIETWLLIASNHPFSGPPELRGQTETDRRRMKYELYGTEAPDGQLMRKKALPIVESFDETALSTQSASFRHFASQVHTLRAYLQSP